MKTKIILAMLSLIFTYSYTNNLEESCAGQGGTVIDVKACQIPNGPTYYINPEYRTSANPEKSDLD